MVVAAAGGGTRRSGLLQQGQLPRALTVCLQVLGTCTVMAVMLRALHLGHAS